MTQHTFDFTSMEEAQAWVVEKFIGIITTLQGELTELQNKVTELSNTIASLQASHNPPEVDNTSAIAAAAAELETVTARIAEILAQIEELNGAINYTNDLIEKLIQLIMETDGDFAQIMAELGDQIREYIDFVKQIADKFNMPGMLTGDISGVLIFFTDAAAPGMPLEELLGLLPFVPGGLAFMLLLFYGIYTDNPLLIYKTGLPERLAEMAENGDHKVGEDGVRIPSKTTGKTGNKKERVDVENPDPGGRDGDVHYHEPNNRKWRYDIETGRLIDPNSHEPAPPKVQRIIEADWFQKALKKGLNMLGES